MMMSAPASAASLAWASVCTWQMILHPASLMRPVNGRRIAERQHYRGRPGVERHLERCGVAFERPQDKADPDPRVAGLRKLLSDRLGAGIARADHSETAGIGHGGGQLAASGRAHWRQQDRVLDAEQAGQRGFDNGHVCSLREVPGHRSCGLKAELVRPG